MIEIDFLRKTTSKLENQVCKLVPSMSNETMFETSLLFFVVKLNQFFFQIAFELTHFHVVFAICISPDDIFSQSNVNEVVDDIQSPFFFAFLRSLEIVLESFWGLFSASGDFLFSQQKGYYFGVKSTDKRHSFIKAGNEEWSGNHWPTSCHRTSISVF